MELDNRIKSIYNNYFILSAVDYKYYNIVFTDKEVILDFINRSFKPWIIRSGIYRTLDYNNLTVEEIKNRHKENKVINFCDIEDIKFSKRTFFKNAFLEIQLKNGEKKVIITKEKAPDEIKTELLNKL